MKERTSVGNVLFNLVWVFLCCYFMQLFNFPNVLTIVIGSFFCLAMLVKQKRFRLDLGTVLLTLTMASYFLILYGNRAFTMALPYVGVLIYVLAHYLACEIEIDHVDKEKYYWKMLCALVIGYSIHGILNSFLFLKGEFQYADTVRIWKDIWEKWYMPGTWQVIFFLPVLACVFPAIIYIKKNKLINMIFLMTAMLFIYISLASESRTSILAFPIVFLVQVILYLLYEREKIKILFKKRNVQYLASVMIVALIIMVIILRKHPLISSFMSIMGRDGGILNNIRFKIHREGLRQLFVYPFGGYQMSFLGYAHAHNTWIDIADAAGIIPFFLFAAYTFLTLYELIRWLMKKEISAERKLMVAGLYGIFFLFYTVEVGLGGSMHYMTPWFFVNAMVHGELSMSKNINKIS